MNPWLFSIGDEDTGHWQYKMSLHQRLLTVTLDLRGACLRMFLLCFTTDLTDWTDLNPLNLLNSLNSYLVVRQKHQKPLGEDGGLCPAVMLPLWSYKSELLTPKTKA